MNKLLKTIVALLEILGGLVGLALIAGALLDKNLNQGAMIVHIGFVLVFLYGILAGAALIKKPRLGLFLSIIYQGIQIPIIMSSKVSFELFAGATFNIIWHETGFGSNLYFGSRYYFNLNSYQPWCFGVNILAFVLFVLLIIELWQEKRTLKNYETELPKVSDQQAMTEMQPNYSWRS